ncbi:hypothetical protein FMEXI_1949 [Fusarium mexicanum]|uniref:Uncharacterized protein n=1 Tax=Fusarium mexicanum TaxID=751941 RepID=A0A8H5JHC7_9HYPO|nr:hypothetical protein FMEXI_1949 [Fusarium mexicanum]
MSTPDSNVFPLTDLPQHILYEICSQFCLHCRGELKPEKGVGTPHQHRRRRPPQKPYHTSWYSLDKNALLSLTLSCKYIHSISEGFLYHEFAPGYGDSDLSKYFTFDSRLNQFMRTIGQRKDLAQKVRMIFIHHKHSHMPEIKETIASLKQGASDLGIDIAAAWQRRVNETLGSTDWRGRHILQNYHYMLTTAFTDQIFEEQHELLFKETEEMWEDLHHELTPMLITLLPRLEHIILPMHTAWQGPLEKDDPFKALGIEQFPHLRTLEIKSESHAMVYKAPNLKELDLLCKFASPLEIEPSFSQRSQISTFRITMMRLGSEYVIGSLPFASKNLRSFVYEADNESVMRLNTFTAEDIVTILHDYHQTLETLHLDFRGTLNDEAIGAIYTPDFTLREFECLRHVFLNTAILFNVARNLEGSDSSFSDESDSPSDNMEDAISRRLPSSIVSLHLAYDKAAINDIEQGLRGLATAKREEDGRFENLGYIGFHYYNGTCRLSGAVHRSMRAAGIEFVYETWPISSL